MKSITFELKDPLEYEKAGENVGASFIELREPTGKQSHICLELESLIQSAAVRMSDIIDMAAVETTPKQANEAEPIDADAALALMTASGVDMQKVSGHCRELFRQVALVDGEKQITVPLMDRMGYRDFKRMMGTYIGVFILS